jgi:hypothetical protein
MTAAGKSSASSRSRRDPRTTAQARFGTEDSTGVTASAALRTDRRHSSGCHPAGNGKRVVAFSQTRAPDVSSGWQVTSRMTERPSAMVMRASTTIAGGGAACATGVHWSDSWRADSQMEWQRRWNRTTSEALGSSCNSNSGSLLRMEVSHRSHSSPEPGPPHVRAAGRCGSRPCPIRSRARARNASKFASEGSVICPDPEARTPRSPCCNNMRSAKCRVQPGL